MAISLGDAANIIRRIEVIRIYKLVMVVGNVPDMDTPRYGNSPYNGIYNKSTELFNNRMISALQGIPHYSHC